MHTPLNELIGALRQNSLIRFMEQFEELFPETHMKDLVVDESRSGREVSIGGKTIVNFGSDSFLGLDQDERVKQAIRLGLERWGTHNGASRAFLSVQANIEAENRLARWLGTETTLIYPSVTLANMGAIPGLVGKQDLLVVDEHAHNSIQEASRIAKANGTRVLTFAHCDPFALQKLLEEAKPYRVAVVAIDGVYSMTGAIPPLMDLNKVCLGHKAVLYVDDAHATAVTGKQGRGTVLEALGSYDNTIVVGSLSKGFSCAGGFIGCSRDLQKLLKMRSNTYIFGGPVVPPYLEAICTVCDILQSSEYDRLIGQLKTNLDRLKAGLGQLGLIFQGGETPIVSVLVGGEEETLTAGNDLFQQGYYVQSVTFPAVPYHAGVLRIQINANHTIGQIDGLLDSIRRLTRKIEFPNQRTCTRAA